MKKISQASCAGDKDSDRPVNYSVEVSNENRKEKIQDLIVLDFSFLSKLVRCLACA